jgi:O-antigen ligase
MKINSFVLLVFPLVLTLILIANNSNKILQFYGEVGRRTGYLTYLSCFLIFAYTAISRINSLYRYTLNLLFTLGILSALYTLIQPLGIFKIYQLDSQNTKPYGFFGNTNFNSGFLGLVSILVISRIFFKSLNWKVKFLNILLLLFFEFSIFQTTSQQGFIVSFSGFVCICLLWVYQKFKFNVVFLFSITISAFLAIQFILGTFNRGLLNNLIWGPSVEARNYYWRAAVNMTNSNPILGVGFDRYGDWYWAYRDVETIGALGIQDFTTSAHNIFLDLSSSGGYVLLISYLILILVIFFAGLSKLKLESSSEFSAIFSMWIGFNVYSLISIGQIGVLVWGWILGGLILNWHKDKFLVNEIKSRKYPKNFTLIVYLIIGFLVAAPVAKESLQIRKATYENSVTAYRSYLNSNFIEPNNIAFAIIKLQEFDSTTESLFFLRKALRNFPDNYKLWETLYFHPESTIQEKKVSYENLLRLNIYNRILSQQIESKN